MAKNRAPRPGFVKPETDREAVQAEVFADVKVEEPPPPPLVLPHPAPVVAEELVEDSQKKTVKTVELVECDTCGKKLTQRTLQHSHPAGCPKNDPSPESSQKPQKHRSVVEAHWQAVEAHHILGTVRQVRTCERLQELLAHAV